MSTKIEQGIEELEEYIAGCPYAAFSKTKILVERDEIEDLIAELKNRIPDEVKKYQKIISQKEAILVKAQESAQKLLADAETRRSQMTSQNGIMQEAYRKASEVERQAMAQAEEVLRSATEQAQGITLSAMQYTDEALADMQDILSNAIYNAQDLSTRLIASLSESLNRIYADRAQLHPQDDEVIANQAIAESEQRARMEAAAAAAAAANEAQAQAQGTAELPQSVQGMSTVGGTVSGTVGGNSVPVTAGQNQQGQAGAASQTAAASKVVQQMPSAEQSKAVASSGTAQEKSPQGGGNRGKRR